MKYSEETCYETYIYEFIKPKKCMLGFCNVNIRFDPPSPLTTKQMYEAKYFDYKQHQKSDIKMRSPRYSRKRSRSPLRLSRPSRSPSPPRPSKKDLQSIRITIVNVKRTDPVHFSILHSRASEPKFSGPEMDVPRTKDQRKIQIEIRRSISAHKVSRSPVRRSIRDPRTVFVSRNSGMVVSSIIFRPFVTCDLSESELESLNHSLLVSFE